MVDQVFNVPIRLPADPTSPMHAATKQYIDSKVGSGGAGGTSFTIASIAPVNPKVGDEWLNADTAIKYTWFVGVSSSCWVEVESIKAYGPTVQTYIQTTQPLTTDPFVWIQTGLGADGSDLTMWFNIP